MAEVGLLGTGEVVRKPQRARCGAKTRSGGECRMAVISGKHRCRMHGGLSSGPKTAEGRSRIAEAQKRRWQRQKEAQPECPPETQPSTNTNLWRRRRRPSDLCG
ncbi:HGGxSTG domain-containing protein [Mesorhizobium sp. CN2-181]|uniref:HGGxSTG domain-containing protein n=1 Tax=Mesorhizobium yinganensis TaxID=3157707 RepID=UPI0032B78BEF